MHVRKATPEVLFGKEIARLRRRIGISQEELGFRADVHRTYISQLERGLKSPTLAVILKVSRALKASVSKLTDRVQRGGDRLVG
jgi:transcriptional regulator with XRE-family HTH domain